MHVPKSPNVGQFGGKSYFSRDLLIGTLGFACYRLYISIFFVTNNVVPQSGKELTLLAYDAYSLLLSLLVLACFFVRRPSVFESRTTNKIAAAFMAIGAMLYALLSNFKILEVFWPFAICTSIGVALATVQWGLALGRGQKDQGAFTVIAGFFLAALCNTGVGIFSTAYAVLAIVIGPLSCAFLIMLHKDEQKSPSCITATKKRVASSSTEGDGNDNRDSNSIDDDDNNAGHSRNATLSAEMAACGSAGADGKYVAKASLAFLLFAVASVFCSIPMEFSVIGLANAPHGVLPLLRTCVTAGICLISFVFMAMPQLSL